MKKDNRAEVIIDTEDMSNYFFKELIKRGFSPTQDEVDYLADITFDYMLSKNMIEEDEE